MTEKFEPIRILGVIEEEVGVPLNDGTRGSALYSIPFLLSRTPSEGWVSSFLRTWKHPPRRSLNHRSNIASIAGNTITLNGTTIEDVKKYHQPTLSSCVAVANEEEAESTERFQESEENRKQDLEEHRRNVSQELSGIRFE